MMAYKHDFLLPRSRERIEVDCEDMHEVVL